MISLPNIQDGPTLGTITCADALILDDVAEWVAVALKEWREVERFYALAKRGFWIGDHFVTVGEGA
jgi:hypothetical protein